MEVFVVEFVSIYESSMFSQQWVQWDLLSSKHVNNFSLSIKGTKNSLLRSPVGLVSTHQHKIFIIKCQTCHLWSEMSSVLALQYIDLMEYSSKMFNIKSHYKRGPTQAFRIAREERKQAIVLPHNSACVSSSRLGKIDLPLGVKTLDIIWVELWKVRASGCTVTYSGCCPRTTALLPMLTWLTDVLCIEGRTSHVPSPPPFYMWKAIRRQMWGSYTHIDFPCEEEPWKIRVLVLEGSLHTSRNLFSVNDISFHK